MLDRAALFGYKSIIRMILPEKLLVSVAVCMCAASAALALNRDFGAEKLSAYIDKFNADDDELYVNSIPNSEAKKFLAENVPTLDTPDEAIDATYYFRWWTFRKHIVKTPEGYVITEFMPKVSWAGKYNTIVCPAAHHIREARWLADGKIAADYAKFWSTARHARSYSFWYADSVLALHSARPDRAMLEALYPALKANYAAWEKSHRDPVNGLFKQKDLADGMELSIAGALNARWEGYRPTINSYMYGECAALAEIAKIFGNADDADYFSQKAGELKKLINENLWSKDLRFYAVMPANGYTGDLANVRELHGYTPWYFGIPPEEYSDAWRQILDPEGFKAKFGLTSAERRDRRFSLNYVGHECQWNGPVWPFATSITLTALANFLDCDQSRPVSKVDFFDALRTYAKSHTLAKPDGKKVFWIDESQHPDNGDWITRTRYVRGGDKVKAYYKERGKDYNHSTFADLVITGLVGIRPTADSSLKVNPLIPDDWKYFRLANVPCKGAKLTVFYDANGSRYGEGSGFFVVADGKVLASADKPRKMEIKNFPKGK